jgi:alpha-1,3-rhamnosyl/mannosyltransferase
MLLDVVLALRQDGSPETRTLRLVLAGADRGTLAALRKRAERAPEALEYIGQPGDSELVNWYRRAAVFAYPSRYEGFGLPVLEAMACGTPVVASAAASIPEVAGPAARLVAVGEPLQWRDAIRALLSDQAQARDLAARGLARAASFTWDRTALATIASYRRAAVQ